jgi:hypothetical protein
MDAHDPPDPPLTREQQERVAALSPAEVQAIDEALLANMSERWRKVARVVGTTMSNLQDRPIGVPDLYYAGRVREFVTQGLIESQGNLTYMRYSEVRPPNGPSYTP